MCFTFEGQDLQPIARVLPAGRSLIFVNPNAALPPAAADQRRARPLLKATRWKSMKCARPEAQRRSAGTNRPGTASTGSETAQKCVGKRE